MDTIYGHFDDLQIEEYKEKLHKEMFWLLLYKDPKTKDEFKNVDFENNFIQFNEENRWFEYSSLLSCRNCSNYEFITGGSQ